MRTAMMAGALVALGACVASVPADEVACAPLPAAPDLSACCAPAREPSDAYRATMEALAPVVVPVLRDMRLRDGHLFDEPAVAAAVTGALQPLDIILVSGKMHVAGNLAQGHFTHAAIALGDEAALRAAGLWDDPALVPLHDAIRAGRTVIEANGRAVDLSTPAEVLNTDAIAILRPRALSANERAASLRRLAGEVGAPFDFAFDAGTQDSLFCTELAAVAIPAADLPRRVILDRETIVPDDIARAAIEGEAPLDLILYLYGSRDGVGTGDAALLAATLAANWPAGGGAP